VIIIGETGCGKTALITFLNKLLNNGKKTVEIINIHPEINDKKLCEKVEKKDEIARTCKDEELWLFFDEINTCSSLSLITEIFINRTYNGKKISDNIRLIGACNPYRRRKENKDICGLSISNDKEKELEYLVQPLPQSLLYYVFSFGSINEEDEKKYIYSIIEKLFTKEERDLHELTAEAISQCHLYLREHFDSSVVSLREIARFVKCVEFFKEYFVKKNQNERKINNDNNNKLRSIICSIYICYYIRLIDDAKRTSFESKLRLTLLKLVNSKDDLTKLNEIEKIIRKDDKENIKEITKEEKEIMNEILSIELTDDEKNDIEKRNLNKNEEEIALKNDKDKLTLEEKIKRIKYFKELQMKYKKYYENVQEKEENLVDNFKNDDLKNEIKVRDNITKHFSEFLKVEQNYLIDQIELDKGIGKNNLLKENVFLLFLSVVTNIPLIIIGKPGSGKSLSAQLISKSMRGEYSKKNFFKLYPKIIQTYFQGSKSTQPKNVKKLFKIAKNKLKYYIDKKTKVTYINDII